jgi:hypothetical protein
MSASVTVGEGTLDISGVAGADPLHELAAVGESPTETSPKRHFTVRPLNGSATLKLSHLRLTGGRVWSSSALTTFDTNARYISDGMLNEFGGSILVWGERQGFRETSLEVNVVHFGGCGEGTACAREGGAISVFSRAQVTVTASTFEACTAQVDGGVIWTRGDEGWARIDIEDTLFKDNRAIDGHGGAVFAHGYSHVNLKGTSNAFAGNRASEYFKGHAIMHTHPGWFGTNNYHVGKTEVRMDCPASTIAAWQSGRSLEEGWLSLKMDSTSYSIDIDFTGCDLFCGFSASAKTAGYTGTFDLDNKPACYMTETITLVSGKTLELSGNASTSPLSAVYWPVKANTRFFTVELGAVLRIKNMQLLGGNGGHDGGSIYVHDQGAALHVSSVRFLGCTRAGLLSTKRCSERGGAIAVKNGARCEISKSTFQGLAAKWGGAIFGEGAGTVISIDSTHFDGNKAISDNDNSPKAGGPAIHLRNGVTVNLIGGNNSFSGNMLTGQPFYGTWEMRTIQKDAWQPSEGTGNSTLSFDVCPPGTWQDVSNTVNSEYNINIDFTGCPNGCGVGASTSWFAPNIGDTYCQAGVTPDANAPCAFSHETSGVYTVPNTDAGCRLKNMVQLSGAHGAMDVSGNPAASPVLNALRARGTVHADYAARHFEVKSGATLTLRHLRIVIPDMCSGTAAGLCVTRGGAIHATGDGTKVVITSVLFSGDGTEQMHSAGAIYITSGAQVVVTASTFENLAVRHSGGAVQVVGDGTTLILSSTYFRNNKKLNATAVGSGGAIEVREQGRVVLEGVENVFIGNLDKSPDGELTGAISGQATETQKGVVSIETCPRGTWQAENQKDFNNFHGCPPCPGGTTTNTSNASGLHMTSENDPATTVCDVPCTRDFYCDGIVGQRPCPLGAGGILLYSSPGSSTEADCAACPMGTTTTSFHPLVCRVCDAGMYQPTTDPSAECVNCTEGRYLEDAGQHASAHERESQCVSCGIGTYASVPLRVAPCKVCPGGFFTAAGTIENLECTSCTAGRFNGDMGRLAINHDDEALSCKMCPAGQFSNAGDSFCFNCPPGKVNNSASCRKCDKGRKSNAEGTHCYACPAGEHNSEPGRAFCLPCLPGKFGNVTGLVDCHDCAARTVSAVSSARRCEGCAVGKYMNEEGKAMCINCPAGKLGRNISQRGGAPCADCARGRFSLQPGSTSCTPCPAGMYLNSTRSTACLSCLPGMFGNTSGMTSCHECPRGMANNMPKRTKCSECDFGSASEDPGSAKCVACIPGKFAASKGLSECALCARGQSFLGVGGKKCLACAAGSAAENPGSTECVVCIPGRFASSLGNVSCDPCAAGKKSAASNATGCVECAVGESSPEGSTLCTSCAPGKYSRAKGEDCTNCAIGSFRSTDDDDPSRCEQCEVGQTTITPGATACDTCDLGKHGVQDARRQGTAAICVACAPGLFQDARGTCTALLFLFCFGSCFCHSLLN